MKVLTAAEMREVDRRTVELGLPDPILMENAGHRVVELLAEKFSPLSEHRILVLCGKGNNGGDGLVVARQLFTRFAPRALWTVLAEAPPANIAMLRATGCPVYEQLTPEMSTATIVVDALLGTGLTGAPRPPYESLIQAINTAFPLARIVSVDIPSGLASDSAVTEWPHVRAHYTVTFTAPKLGQVLEPNASACGELRVGHIGSPDSLLPAHLQVTEPAHFAHLFAPRPATAHKGDFGHVLVVGGAAGKTGAAAMCGLAALRSGAGLVTLCADAPAPYPELMHEPLGNMRRAAAGKTVLAVGPGLGTSSLVKPLLDETRQPVVVDADGLNNMVGQRFPRRESIVLTPHPGEMARLLTSTTADIQQDRLGNARFYAKDRGVTVVLKGRNTVIAFPDGLTFINPTGGPAIATGGSGDILTGFIAGLIAQSPDRLREAVLAAVWLHGRAGDLAAAELGEQCVIATDLLGFLPRAIHDLRH
jgi:NAD(P)H-hydrate epimerase